MRCCSTRAARSSGARSWSAAFVFSDSLDGIMARLQGRSTSWGAFLDSTLDRVGDAAIFGGLVMFYAIHPHERWATLMTSLTLACLVLGQIVSYARARAEGLGMTAAVGVAERADRLVAVLLTTGLVGLGLPPVVLLVVLALLAVASLVTVVQRVLVVRRQAFAAAAPPASRHDRRQQTPGTTPGPPLTPRRAHMRERVSLWMFASAGAWSARCRSGPPTSSSR